MSFFSSLLGCSPNSPLTRCEQDHLFGAAGRNNTGRPRTAPSVRHVLPVNEPQKQVSGCGRAYGATRANSRSFAPPPQQRQKRPSPGTPVALRMTPAKESFSAAR